MPTPIEVTDEQIARAEQTLTIERKIIAALKTLDDPKQRARVLRAVIALHGLDET